MGNFWVKYVKLTTFFFFYFTLTDAIALIVTFIMIEAPCNSTDGINGTINFLIHIMFVSYWMYWPIGYKLNLSGWVAKIVIWGVLHLSNANALSNSSNVRLPKLNNTTISLSFNMSLDDVLENAKMLMTWTMSFWEPHSLASIGYSGNSLDILGWARSNALMSWV